MHKTVVFIDLLRVSLGRKASKTFLEHVNAQRLVASDAHIQPQVELMTVDEERVCNVLRNNRSFVNIYVVDIIHQVNTFALTGVCGLDDPDILLAFMLLQLLVVIVKVTELVGQNVGVRHKVEGAFSVPLLHANNVETKSIFTRDFV